MDYIPAQNGEQVRSPLVSSQKSAGMAGIKYLPLAQRLASPSKRGQKRSTTQVPVCNPALSYNSQKSRRHRAVMAWAAYVPKSCRGARLRGEVNSPIHQWYASQRCLGGTIAEPENSRRAVERKRGTHSGLKKPWTSMQPHTWPTNQLIPCLYTYYFASLQ